MSTSGTIAIGAGALALAWLGATGWSVQAGERRAREVLEERLARLETAPEEVEEPPEDGRLARELEELGTRLARLEARAKRAPAAQPATAKPAGDGVGAASAVEAVAPERASPAKRAELDQLLEKLSGANWDFGAMGEDFQRFLALAREEGVLDDAIADLEARIAAAPDDLEARMELADYYVGKLMTISGPEQGLWGGKAEDQWKAVVERDAEHFDAHASLGIGYSYYPPVMGKAPLAIEHLERALEIQEHGAPKEQEVECFLFLSRLQRQNGEPARARETLERGLARFPGRPELVAALGELGG